MNYEILAPGMVYYKEAIPEPNLVIDQLELIQDKILSGVHSAAAPWHEWNGSNPDTEKFCKRYFYEYIEKIFDVRDFV